MAESQDVAEETTDFIVVGSGAGGASAALTLSQSGARVTVLEEGPWLTTKDFGAELRGALHTLWRDSGYQVARGRGLIPVLEGRCVGGSTVISGAILHPMPRSVWQEWAEDKGIADALPWDLIEATRQEIDGELGAIAKLDPLLPNLAIVRLLRARGTEIRAMRRSAPGCRHTGRCLLGCPSGGKWSMERSFVPRAVNNAARVIPRCRATRIAIVDGRANGVEAVISSNDGRKARRFLVKAEAGVLIACGTVRSPLLLAASGVSSPSLGRNFQTHVGSAVVGLYDRAAADIEGPAMGLEIFDPEGFKLATQVIPPELLFSRLPILGSKLSDAIRHYDRYSAWTSSVRSVARGTVRRSWLGKPVITYDPAPSDLVLVRKAARRMAENFFEMGAIKVFPQIYGVPSILSHMNKAVSIESAALDPRAYPIALTHLFGTCRMGSNSQSSVVAPDFQVHGLRGLYVVDASCFPTNLGVNPQGSIMTLARIAARRAVEHSQL